MPRLIADIGGTSSRWALLPSAGKDAATVRLSGFNPASGDSARLQEELRSHFPSVGGNTGILQVSVYGAGCGTKARSERMRLALAEVWPGAEIAVESDLLGAARSLYGREQGLVLILGTGMNAGHYDGSRLHLPMPSLGYVLGDEGSGADIGKHLLRDALYGNVPEALFRALFPDGLDLAAILDAVHRTPAPQAFLASFAGPLANHQRDLHVHDLVASRFDALARLLVRFFSSEETRYVRASGSVASGFRGILKDVLAHRGMQLMAAEADPMPGLLRYHALSI